MIFNQAHHNRLQYRLDHHATHLSYLTRRRPGDPLRAATFDAQVAEVTRALACFEEQIAAYERARLEDVVELASRAERADRLVEARLGELHEVMSAAA